MDIRLNVLLDVDLFLMLYDSNQFWIDDAACMRVSIYLVHRLITFGLETI